MHILIISHGYPTAKNPQWGCFEQDQAEALVSMGHRVTVAVLDMRFRPSNQTFGISHISFVIGQADTKSDETFCV